MSGEREEVQDDALAFAAWLTSRPGVLTVGSGEECGSLAAAFAEWRKANPLRAPASEGEVVDEHIVRHPNGHLMVERVPAWVPTEEQTNEALKSLGKAWPYLADHAPHIDGEFNTAHGNLTRYIERFRELLATHPAPATVTEAMVQAGARQMARHFAAKTPLTRHDDAALARVAETFLGESRAILTAALGGAK